MDNILLIEGTIHLYQIDLGLITLTYKKSIYDWLILT